MPIKCEECGGSGVIEKNIPSRDIYAEADVECVCDACGGTGHIVKLCDKPCSPSDWYKGGKCDINGCYYE